MKRRRSPALRPCCAGIDMFPGWRMIACLKFLLYSKLSTGYRGREAPKKRFKDCLKKSFVACHINHCQWSTLPENRNSWRLTTNHAVSFFENTCRATLRDKRQRRKYCNAMPSSTGQTFSCNLSVTNVLTSNMYRLPCDLCLAKPSHDTSDKH